MNTQGAPDDGEFERWLEDRLDTHLGVHADGAAPSDARYLSQGRRRFTRAPLQLALASAVAVLAIGGGAAYAAGLVHGTSVSSAAHSCSTAPADAHGDCVATVAHSSTSSTTTTSSSTTTHSNNDAHGDAVSNAAHTCPTSPPGAHGQCVSNIASGGKSGGNASSTSTSSSPAANPHGNSGNAPPQGNSHH